jgi:hypothetical protein
MTVQYPLRIFLDLSTAHLTPKTRGSLMPYGWFVWAEEDPNPENFPDDLIACMNHARSLGAEYILFDCDALEVAELPVYGDDD